MASHRATPSTARRLNFTRIAITLLVLLATVAAVVTWRLSSSGTSASAQGASARKNETHALPTPAALAARLGCTAFVDHGIPVSHTVGAVMYACTGSEMANGAWTSQFIDSSYGQGQVPTGPPPAFTELVFFTSAGAKAVLVQQDRATHEKERSDPQWQTGVLEQLATLDPSVPDVVGPNWLMFGNDTSMTAAAVNAGGSLQPE